MCFSVGVGFLVVAFILGVVVLWDFFNSMTDGESNNESIEEDKN